MLFGSFGGAGMLMQRVTLLSVTIYWKINFAWLAFGKRDAQDVPVNAERRTVSCFRMPVMDIVTSKPNEK